MRYTKLMATPRKLPKIKPVSFPTSRSATSGAYVLKGSKGKPTREVIAEMRKLSKKDIYPADK